MIVRMVNVVGMLCYTYLDRSAISPFVELEIQEFGNCCCGSWRLFEMWVQWVTRLSTTFWQGASPPFETYSMRTVMSWITTTDWDMFGIANLRPQTGIQMKSLMGISNATRKYHPMKQGPNRMFKVQKGPLPGTPKNIVSQSVASCASNTSKDFFWFTPYPKPEHELYNSYPLSFNFFWIFLQVLSTATFPRKLNNTTIHHH